MNKIMFHIKTDPMIGKLVTLTEEGKKVFTPSNHFEEGIIKDISPKNPNLYIVISSLKQSHQDKEYRVHKQFLKILN